MEKNKLLFSYLQCLHRHTIKTSSFFLQVLLSIISQTLFIFQLFINNEWVDAISKKTFETHNPANGKKIADIAEGDKEDVELAIAAAKKAFARGSVYRNLNASDRTRLMLK